MLPRLDSCKGSKSHTCDYSEHIVGDMITRAMCDRNS